jgi:hypothetical protein
MHMKITMAIAMQASFLPKIIFGCFILIIDKWIFIFAGEHKGNLVEKPGSFFWIIESKNLYNQ